MEPVNYEGMINNVITEAADLAVQTARLLEHQFEEIVMDPLAQVDAAVQSVQPQIPKNFKVYAFPKISCSIFVFCY